MNKFSQKKLVLKNSALHNWKNQPIAGSPMAGIRVDRNPRNKMNNMYLLFPTWDHEQTIPRINFQNE